MAHNLATVRYLQNKIYSLSGTLSYRPVHIVGDWISCIQTADCLGKTSFQLVLKDTLHSSIGYTVLGRPAVSTDSRAASAPITPRCVGFFDRFRLGYIHGSRTGHICCDTGEDLGQQFDLLGSKTMSDRLHAAGTRCQNHKFSEKTVDIRRDSSLRGLDKLPRCHNNHIPSHREQLKLL